MSCENPFVGGMAVVSYVFVGRPGGQNPNQKISRENTSSIPLRSTITAKVASDSARSFMYTRKELTYFAHSPHIYKLAVAQISLLIIS